MLVLVSAAPQGKAVVVSALEAQGTTPQQLATVRDAVLAELKVQGYDARAEDEGAPRGAAGTVGGAVVLINGTFEVMLRLKENATRAIIATSTVVLKK